MVSELRRKAAPRIPGHAVFFAEPAAIRIGGRSAKSLYQFTLQGTDIDALYAEAGDCSRRKLRELPQLTDVTTDLLIANPQLTRRHRPRPRGRARRHGPADRERALQRLRHAAGVHHLHAHQRVLGGDGAACRSPSRTRRRSRSLYVRVERGQARAARRRWPRSSDTVGPLTVNHSGQMPSVTISFNLAPGVSLGAAVDAVQRDGRAQTLPATITTALLRHRAGVRVVRSRAWGCCSCSPSS